MSGDDVDEARAGLAADRAALLAAAVAFLKAYPAGHAEAVARAGGLGPAGAGLVLGGRAAAEAAAAVLAGCVGPDGRPDWPRTAAWLEAACGPPPARPRHPALGAGAGCPPPAAVDPPLPAPGPADDPADDPAAGVRPAAALAALAAAVSPADLAAALAASGVPAAPAADWAEELRRLAVAAVEATAGPPAAALMGDWYDAG